MLSEVGSTPIPSHSFIKEVSHLLSGDQPKSLSNNCGIRYRGHPSLSNSVKALANQLTCSRSLLSQTQPDLSPKQTHLGSLNSDKSIPYHHYSLGREAVSAFIQKPYCLDHNLSLAVCHLVLKPTISSMRAKTTPSI